MQERVAPTVSAIIKAKNESHQIGACIHSLDGLADEVIVVDDRSSDGTSALALAAGAIVIAGCSRDGHINALDRLGFDTATGQWLLRLDADERMTPTLASELKRHAKHGSIDGVRFARQNIMFGAWARYGGWFKADQLRFFRRSSWDKSETGWEQSLHDHPTVRGNIVSLPEVADYATVHYDYDSVPEFASRSLEKYARTDAHVRYQLGFRFSAIRLVWRFPRTFLGRYLLRRGFKDGRRGLVLAALLAMYDCMIEINLWDLDRPQGPAS